MEGVGLDLDRFEVWRDAAEGVEAGVVSSVVTGELVCVADGEELETV